MRRLFYFLLPLLICINPVQAAPSLAGSTGMIDNPSADVLREGQISTGYYHVAGGTQFAFSAYVAPRVEVGTIILHDQDGKHTGLNAKFSLRQEQVNTPAVAVGVEDIAGYRDTSWYAVASKSLPFGIRLHAGVGNGRFNGVFGGVEKQLNTLSVLPGKYLPSASLMAEFDGRQMNYGLRFAVAPGVKLDGGWRKHGSYFGISYTH
ncbi:YjbH domain-containing protein [Propionispora hippei]|uniref:Exopolysaccharide biosynthesis protein YbjH n=1 Tax=Propionispora hippei DSM 15287 TaxID=1123003 RepID=A0A1M6ENJ3_9FIRM|nr:YjbH domain-containing protein [Propionispora hippei]SHI87041.1 Exopolysaccharide biosynthesis protein YbjH [Propionispora hippei DSM 15287]